MKVNGSEYGFSIFPSYGKVQAEIYKVSEFKDGQKVNIRLLGKEFGSVFRTPNEEDYRKARKWARLQMKYIEDANS